MAKKKPKVSSYNKQIEGNLIFKSIDRMTAKFEMEDQGQGGQRRVEFPASEFPPDYDPTHDEVRGSYMIEWEIVRKVK